MFHIELRHASNRLSRLNLSESELMTAVLQPWMRGEKVELGDRAWMPDETEIIVIEGPEVPIGGMTVGRGWPTAQRNGRDVTKEAFTKARRRVAEEEATKASGGASAGARSGERDAHDRQTAGDKQAAGDRHAMADLSLLADSLGLELLRRLSEGEMPLQAAWQLAAERHPRMTPSSTLELAAAAIASLANSKLIAVVRDGAESAAVPAQELASALADVRSWSSGDPHAAMTIRRL